MMKIHKKMREELSKTELDFDHILASNLSPPLKRTMLSVHAKIQETG